MSPGQARASFDLQANVLAPACGVGRQEVIAVTADKSPGEAKRPARAAAPSPEAAPAQEPAPESGSVAPAAAQPAAPAAAVADLQTQTVGARKGQYLVAARPAGLLAPMAAPLDPRSLKDALDSDPTVDHVKTLRLEGVVSRLSMDVMGGASDIEVVRMDHDRAASLQQQFGHRAHIEHDAVLQHGPVGALSPASASPSIGFSPSASGRFAVSLTIVGNGGVPVEGVSVTIFGSQGNGVGVTGADGKVQVALGAETPDTIIGLVASPRSDYWMTWIRSPLLDPARNNIVQLLPLTAEFPEFPQHELTGWGLAAMGLDQLPVAMQGQGVKVGVIDSGIAGDHQDLAGQVEGGVSVVDQDPNAWNQDEEGHGTHVAGIIAGLANGAGIRGIAPGVKLRAYKIFPGGRFSDLVNALDHCVQDQVDVVNLSLGTAETSDLVEQRLLLAKQQGVACIVAAGNSSGPVMFPGSSGQVMTVAAIGQRGTFPDGSWHVNDPVVGNGLGFSSDGYFSPTFSCFGPEVRICAPGVAVVSSFPPNDYAALDGTSMAAPFVTGLAALVLAHHPDFQGPYKSRNAARVDRLFQLLMQGSRPLALGDPTATAPRVGAGLASVAAVTLQPQAALPLGAIAPAWSAPRLTPAAAPAAALQSSALSQSDLVNIIGGVVAAVMQSMSGQGAGQPAAGLAENVQPPIEDVVVTSRFG